MSKHDQAEANNEIQLDAVAMHYKRASDHYQSEAIVLANALREAVAKNGELVAIAQSLQQQIEIMSKSAESGSVEPVEIIPPSKPNGKAAKVN
jgi:transcription antitermination factor NusA-like protein